MPPRWGLISQGCGYYKHVGPTGLLFAVHRTGPPPFAAAHGLALGLLAQGVVFIWAVTDKQQV
jgi:hypothetical protein